MRGLAFAVLGTTGLLFVLGGSRGGLGPPPPPTSRWLPGNPPPPPEPEPPEPPSLLPQPRAKPKTVTLEALNRYELVVDARPVEGVGRMEFADKAIAFFGLAKPTLRGAKSITRPDGWEVTRVTLEANAVTRRVVDLDRPLSIGGAGTVWVISARQLGKF